MAKLFKQGFDLVEKDTFYVVAENKKQADEIITDSTKEVYEELVTDALPMPTTEVEEVTTLTPEEEEELKDVIWTNKGLKSEILEKKLKRLSEIL